MPAKKRFFTKNKQKIYHSPQDRTSIGNKSVNNRESIRLDKLAQDKKKAKEVGLSLQEKHGDLLPIKLPNISLSITELLKKLKHQTFSPKTTLLWVFIVVLSIASIVGVIYLAQSSVVFGQVVMHRLQLKKDMMLWENISQKYPTYRDASFQVAVLAYRLGETQKEKTYLIKTLAIDPNFQPARSLAKKSQ